MQLTAAVAALLFGSFVAHSAKAQQATYTVTLTNNATYPIFGDYDAPTTTGGMPGIWFSGGLTRPIHGGLRICGFSVWVALRARVIGRPFAA